MGTQIKALEPGSSLLSEAAPDLPKASGIWPPLTPQGATLLWVASSYCEDTAEAPSPYSPLGTEAGLLPSAQTPGAWAWAPQPCPASNPMPCLIATSLPLLPHAGHAGSGPGCPSPVPALAAVTVSEAPIHTPPSLTLATTRPMTDGLASRSPPVRCCPHEGHLLSFRTRCRFLKGRLAHSRRSLHWGSAHLHSWQLN